MGKADFLSKSHAGAIPASFLETARPGGTVAAGLLADVGQQRHEARPLDGVFDRPLKGRAVAAALAAEELALAGAKLLEALHVSVIDEHGARAAVLGAEPAAILPTPTELLANHRNLTVGLSP